MNGIYKKTPSMYKQLRLYYYITVCLYIFVHISICIILWFASPDDQEWQMLSGGREAFSERPDFFKAMDLFNSCREKDSNQTFFEPFEILNCCLTGRNPAPLGMYKTLWKWDILDIHWLARFLNHQQCSPCFPCFLQSTWNFQLVLRKHPCFNPLHHESEKKTSQSSPPVKNPITGWPMHTAPPVKPRQRAPAQHTKKSRLQRTNLTWPLSKQPRFGSSYSDSFFSKSTWPTHDFFWQNKNKRLWQYLF